MHVLGVAGFVGLVLVFGSGLRQVVLDGFLVANNAAVVALEPKLAGNSSLPQVFLRLPLSFAKLLRFLFCILPLFSDFRPRVAVGKNVEARELPFRALSWFADKHVLLEIQNFRVALSRIEKSALGFVRAVLFFGFAAAIFLHNHLFFQLLVQKPAEIAAAILAVGELKMLGAEAAAMRSVIGLASVLQQEVAVDLQAMLGVAEQSRLGLAVTDAPEGLVGGTVVKVENLLRRVLGELRPNFFGEGLDGEGVGSGIELLGEVAEWGLEGLGGELVLGLADDLVGVEQAGGDRLLTDLARRTGKVCLELHYLNLFFYFILSRPWIDLIINNFV